MGQSQKPGALDTLKRYIELIFGRESLQATSVSNSSASDRVDTSIRNSHQTMFFSMVPVQPYTTPRQESYINSSPAFSSPLLLFLASAFALTCRKLSATIGCVEIKGLPRNIEEDCRLQAEEMEYTTMEGLWASSFSHRRLD